MELLIAQNDDAQVLANRIALAHKLGHKKIAVLLTKQTLQLKGSIKDVEWLLLARTVNEVVSLRKNCDAVIAPARREFFESKTVKYILNPEESSRADFMHHRNSGLNQVLLNLCKRSNKEIITTLDMLDKNPAIILGRMMQNVTFCSKYGVPYHVVSGAYDEWRQRGASDINALMRVLIKK